MNEIWKDIVGYEGYYQVSNLGNVRSLPKVITQKSNGGGFHEQRRQGKVLVPVKNSKGYYRVMLHMPGGFKRFFVHRLVAEYFIPNRDNKPVVNHIDSNPLNNHVSNLEWVTHKENSRHAVDNGRFANIPKGEDTPQSKLKETDVRWILDNAVKGDKELGFKALARKFGVTPQHIGQIVSKKKWGHIQ
jgi:hypothetical protein